MESYGICAVLNFLTEKEEREGSGRKKQVVFRKIPGTAVCYSCCIDLDSIDGKNSFLLNC